MPYIRNPIFPWQFPLRRRVHWTEVQPSERADVILGDELALAPAERDARVLWRIVSGANMFRAVLLAGAAALASPAHAGLVGTLDVSASSPSFSAEIINEPLASATSGYFSLPVGTGQILLAIDQAASTFLVRLVGAPSLVSASWAVSDLPGGWEASPAASGALGAGTGDASGNQVLSSGLITISELDPAPSPRHGPPSGPVAPIVLGGQGGLGQVAVFGVLCFAVALWRFAEGRA